MIFYPLISRRAVFTAIHKKLQKDLKMNWGEEQWTFIEGCEREWEELPAPESPLAVGIDGGFVHARDGDNRKAGWFEVIVGKSMSDQRDFKRFGFVRTYDEKSKRRLFETLSPIKSLKILKKN